MTQIFPFGNNILVRPVEVKQVLVNQSRSLYEFGDVLAIGEDVKRIKVGDKIAYTIWGIKSIEIENEKHYFIPEDDRFILGKIELS